MGYLGNQITTVFPTSISVDSATISGNTTIGGTLGVTGATTLSDNVVFDASSKGVHLGVTSATASNLLNDYEEGTWTPTIIGVSSGTKTAGSGNVGRYVVVGNHCTISGTVHCDGTETLSGAIAMGGLPFAVANISSYRIGCTLGGTTGLGMPSGYQSGFAMGGDPGNSFVYILARSTTGFSHNPTVANVTNLYGINMTYQIS